jgi:hypothetical protein
MEYVYKNKKNGYYVYQSKTRYSLDDDLPLEGPDILLAEKFNDSFVVYDFIYTYHERIPYNKELKTIRNSKIKKINGLHL